MTVTTQVSPPGDAVRVEDVPDPQVPERAKRRSYSAKYKAEILAEYDRLDRDGRGALLRREALYSSLISEWRKQRDKGALEALGKTRGRPPADPVERENARLRAEVAKLQAEVETSRRVIEVQGKLSALLEQLATGGATDEDRAR
jgi:transposase